MDDPAAQFSDVQVTGNSSTGQTCDFVTAETDSQCTGKAGRFIVYIDDAGPFLEQGLSVRALSRKRFAWENDCEEEDYKP